MKLRDILRGAATIMGTLHPGIGAAIGLVNNFLPDDKKIPESSTGAEVQAAIATLTPGQQSSIMEREIDLKISQEEGWTERYKAMCQSDGQETRAKIANKMCNMLCAITTLFCIIVAWQIHKYGMSNLSENSSIWMVFGILVSTPTTLLMNYFGNLRNEQANRQTAISGQKMPSPASIMSVFRLK